MHAREQLKAPSSIDNPFVWVPVGLAAAAFAYIYESQLTQTSPPNPGFAAGATIIGVAIFAVFGGVFFRLACHWALNLDVQWPGAWQRCVVTQGIFALAAMPAQLSRGKIVDYTTSPDRWLLAYEIAAFAIVSWLITALICRYQPNERFGLNRAAKVALMETIIVICAGLLAVLALLIFSAGGC